MRILTPLLWPDSCIWLVEGNRLPSFSQRSRLWILGLMPPRWGAEVESTKAFPGARGQYSCNTRKVRERIVVFMAGHAVARQVSRFWLPVISVGFLVGADALGPRSVLAQAPGSFLENSGSTTVRPFCCRAQVRRLCHRGVLLLFQHRTSPKVSASSPTLPPAAPTVSCPLDTPIGAISML
jgi:hypothetical protein